MIAKTFGDLLGNHAGGEIACMYTGNVVRRLERLPGGNIRVIPGEGPALVVSPETPITFEPWVLDRGNLLFTHPEYPGQTLKICGELDTITYPDGTVDTIRAR